MSVIKAVVDGYPNNKRKKMYGGNIPVKPAGEKLARNHKLNIFKELKCTMTSILI